MSDRISFLQEKARNFREYIMGQSPDAELSVQLQGFSDLLIVPTLVALLPSLKARGLKSVVDELLAHLKPEDPAATREKLGRYFACFCEVLSE